MAGHVYRVTEIVGTSSSSIDDAITSGLDRAAQTVRNIDWFEVGQIRGHVEDGVVGHYQVALKVGFRIEDPSD